MHPCNASVTLRKQTRFHFHPRPLGQVWGWRAPWFNVGWKLRRDDIPKGDFFVFLERNSNFWSPQHDWKTKIIWNWSPTYSNSHDLSRFKALPVTWAEERPHDQGRMVQPLYSSANQVAQTRAARYLESTRLAGQGEELDVFFIVFLLKLRPNFCIHRHMSSEEKTTGYFWS